MPALIITLTLNPALDLATTADHVVPTNKLRCGPVRRFAGGGAAGAQVQQLLADEGVPTQLQRIAGDTRENFSVVETTTGQEFRFVLPGPTLQTSEWQACLDALATHAPPPRWLIASGSLPPGTPDDFYAQLVRAVSAVSGQGVRVAVDTSGPPLAAALQAGVALVKPSLRELRELLQQPLEHAADWCTAAQSLVRSGAADIVALSIGEQGAVLATREGVWQAPALNVPSTTGTTGAGDCFLAALVWALDQGDAPAEALRWGVAAGAAALLHPGTTLAQADDVQRLVRSVPAPVAFNIQP